MSEGQFQPELPGIDTNPVKGNFLGAHAMNSGNLITNKASPVQGEQSQKPDVPLGSNEHIREEVCAENSKSYQSLAKMTKTRQRNSQISRSPAPRFKTRSPWPHFIPSRRQFIPLELILSRLEPHEQFKYVNAPDVDGWTPICWAMRPIMDPTTRDKSGSEPMDYETTVRCLLKYGARRDIQCKMGKGQNAETFTLLELARLHSVSSDIIPLIIRNRNGAGEYTSIEKDPDKKTYLCQLDFCAICYSQIYGKIYVCYICNSFRVCKKCCGRIDEYYEKDDIETHGHLPPFQEFNKPSPPPPAASENVEMCHTDKHC
ncbi:hypothetical protein F4813DRAFT_389917 [Daldinia decipiens]|uniref:uncharacterized protein n=1 Tax=Daldinia decipiens TaxID=326647 RepID=UPI0020C208E5|nr:uncharacterized protein F4813DRAFT_389917 [Daldinia decipiens]KAI1657332.1 hypothetical protein F4813DRAFT_389917 [Daldinia decipiens]